VLARLRAGVGAIAEKISAGYGIPAGWKARTGASRATDVLPGTYPGFVSRTARLAIRDGVMLWNTDTLGMSTSQVLAPAGPRRAFTFGFAPFYVERGAGDVRSSRCQCLRYSGGTEIRRAFSLPWTRSSSIPLRVTARAASFTFVPRQRTGW
jgi:hypothetical protein